MKKGTAAPAKTAPTKPSTDAPIGGAGASSDPKYTPIAVVSFSQQAHDELERSYKEGEQVLEDL